jgi:hypothetical protein
MRPGFLRESLAALQRHPNAGFSFCLCEYIDANGETLSRQGDAGFNEGCLAGLDLLERMVSVGWVIHTVSVVMRASALQEVGRFESPHSKSTFDLNFYLRLAAHTDAAFIRRPLIHLRVHAGQLSEGVKRTAGGDSAFSSTGECLDAIGYLLRSPRAAHERYRRWLTDRLLALNARRSEYAHFLLPHIYWTWYERLQMVRATIEAHIPPDASMILVDGDQLASGGTLAGRPAFPFTEHQGYFNGPPANDAAALAELERLRKRGASYLVFAWPGFALRDQYPEFSRTVAEQFDCPVKNPHVVIFDLRSHAPAGGV